MTRLKNGTLILLILAVAWLPLWMGAWDNTLPANDSVWNAAAGMIRDNWDHFETQFGVGITGNLQITAVTITNSELKDLADTPIELVAAQGVGTLIEFVGATLVLNYGSEVLVESADNLVIEYDTGAGAACSEVIEMTGFIDQTADTVTNAIRVKDVVDASADIVNKNIALFNNSGDFTGNASNDTTLRVLVSFRVHRTLGL